MANELLSVACAPLVSRSAIGLALFAAGILPFPSQAAVQFAYDLSGRLIQATSSDGTAVQYQYDPAGNLLAVQPLSTGSISITSFSPSGGPTGTQVTISGVGFDATTANDTVTIGGAAAQIVSASTNQLIVIVPDAAVTGQISVSDAVGTATSQGNFMIGSLLAVGNPAVSASISPGASTTLTFSGKAGDGLSLSISGLTPGGTVTATVATPDGVTLTTCNTSGSSLLCALPTLPIDGTYTLTFSATVGASSTSVQVIPDVSGGTLSPNLTDSFNATAGTPAISYTFVATDHENDLGLSLGQDSISGNTNITVYGPTGSVISSTTVTPATVPAQINFGTLGGGSYRVRIIPATLGGGALQVTLSQFVSAGTLVPGGAPASVDLATGQSTGLSFNGKQGTDLGIGIDSFSSAPVGQSVILSLLNSSMTQIWSATVTGNSSFALPMLPVDDTYTLSINPGAASSKFNLHLTSDLATLLSLDGSAVTFAPSTVGVNASYTFDGVAGQGYSLSFLSNSFPQPVNVYVMRPDGVQWLQTTLYTSSTATQFSLPNAPIGGTYTVRVVPSGTVAGTLVVGVTKNIASNLTIDDAPIAGNLAAGQTTTLNFSGSMGQLLGVGLTDFSTVPSGQPLSLNLADSSGTVIDRCTVTISEASRMNAAGCALPALPADDTYSLIVSAGANAANFHLALVSDQIGTLSPGSVPSVFTTGKVGQSASYQWPTQRGQNYVVSFSAVTAIGATGAYLYNPDGTLNSSGTILEGVNSQVSLTPAITNGNYSIRLTPTAWETQVDSMSISLSNVGTSPIGGSTAGALAVGAPVNVDITNGQTTSYTFSGTRGEYVGLGFSNFSGAGVNVVVANSSGTTLASFPVSATTGYALPRLPTTDIYTVSIVGGSAEANFNLTMSPDQVASVTLNASPTIFNSNIVGQYALAQMTVAAGKTYTIGVPADTFSGSMSLYIYLPDGTLWQDYLSQINPANSSTFPAYITLPVVPVTGTYSVRFVPDTAATGSISVSQLQTIAAGTITPGNVEHDVSLQPGQPVSYSFAGAKNQMFGIGLVNASLPSNSYFNLSLTNSNGVQVWAYNTLSDRAFAIPALPKDDTYVLTFNIGSTSGTFGFYLTPDITATLQVNGAALKFAPTVAGQDASYSFSGNAGQNYTISFSGNDYTSVSVYKPDGALLTQQYLYQGFTTSKIELKDLPVDGSYIVRMVPLAGTPTGISVGVSHAIPGVLIPGGSSVPINLAAGQQAIYSFSGNVGDALGLGLTNLVTNPGNSRINLTLSGPDGTQLWTIDTSDTTASFAMPYLPVTGMYTLSATPQSSSAAFNLQLPIDQSGDIGVNSTSPTFTSTTVGQNATYDFSGQAGQHYTLALAGNTRQDSFAVYVYNPNNSLWMQTVVSNSWLDFEIDLPNAPATGSYHVRLVPTVGNSGSVTVGVAQKTTSTITPGGGAFSVNLSPGHDHVYTFSGTQGQSLGVGLSNFSTMPNGRSINLTLTGSDGSTVWSNNTNSDSGFIIPALPKDGVYSLLVRSDGAGSSFNFDLTVDKPFPLVLGNPPMSLVSTEVGQNFISTFNVYSGTDFILNLDSNSHLDSLKLYVYRADGSLWDQETILPGENYQSDFHPTVTGYCVIRIAPYLGHSGTVNVGIGTPSSVTVEN
ncbi:beta strand repeat-containing protein [Burkholderia sp. 22PA0099]|uniref:beta strand repeat-containing protein n=1 Tax=Burkholderia sp. 22PA0099 TaxID=3237372 RepID=UPI0039C2FF9C